MSTNCIRCVVRKRTGPDLLCDTCRATPPQIQRDKAQIEAAADSLLYPGDGGVALWVRRDELLPRAAVRFRTKNKAGENVDHSQVITILATLQVALDRVKHAMADEMCMPRELFNAMCDDAHKVLMPKFEVQTAIRRGP